MKRFLLPSALAVALAGSIAFAQQAAPPATPEGHGFHHRQMDPHKAALHLGKKLNLSADQTAKLEPIFAARQQKFAALRADTTLTPHQRHQQMRQLHQDTEQQLAGVLTPDQLAQLNAMHHGRHGRGDGASAAQPNGTNL